MLSDGHYETMVSSEFRKVNIGIAWDDYTLWLVQQFEGDFIFFTQPPELSGTRLQFGGYAAPDVDLAIDQHGLKAEIYFHPVKKLTRGQLADAYCLDRGKILASLVSPAPPGYSYTADDLRPVEYVYDRCPSPYDMEGSDGPSGYQEAKARYKAAKARLKLRDKGPVGYVVADEWDVGESSFQVSADIGNLLRKPGAYQLIIWGRVNGQEQQVAEYWLFYQVAAPTNYR